jgi:hypothetical protein
MVIFRLNFDDANICQHPTTAGYEDVKVCEQNVKVC